MAKRKSCAMRSERPKADPTMHKTKSRFDVFCTWVIVSGFLYVAFHWIKAAI